MSKTADSPTPEEMVQAVLGPSREALARRAITWDFLATRLKAELNAKEEFWATDKETGEKKKVGSAPLWPIRQKARQDAWKYLGGDEAAGEMPGRISVNIHLEPKKDE